MAYGDRLQVRVRSTGDFRFENRPEDQIEEIGIIVNNSIELNMDELHEALELDTRGTPVRQFDGHQRYIDAGADGAFLDFVVNVASDVAALGLTGTIAYVRGKVRGRQQLHGQERATTITDNDFERVAVETIQLKSGVTHDKIQIESVESGIDGKGIVELTIPENGLKFRVDLELHDDGIRVYRIKRANPTPLDRG